MLQLLACFDLVKNVYGNNPPPHPPPHLRVDDEDIRLMLWDTAGQEEFDSITKAYYRGTPFFVFVRLSVCMHMSVGSPLLIAHTSLSGAQACVLAFSTVDRASFEAIEQWKEKVSYPLSPSKHHFITTPTGDTVYTAECSYYCNNVIGHYTLPPTVLDTPMPVELYYSRQQMFIP